MNRSTISKLAWCAFFTALFHLIPVSHAAIIAAGSLTDALEGSQTDLASASITVDSGGAITFSVTLGPAALTNTAMAFINLDSDQNTATGFAGVDSGNNDAALMGTDYLVVIRAQNFQANAQIRAFGGGVFTTVATLSVDYLGSTLSTTANLSDFGGDDGLMNFKVIGAQQLNNTTTTPVQDYMSDLGQPVGRVTVVPVPSTWLLLGTGLLGLCARRRVAAAS